MLRGNGWTATQHHPRAWCRDYGARIDRQKARLMWLVETMGADSFREKIGEYMGVKLRTKVEEKVSADKVALIGFH